jgi:hypothetical protein
MKISELRACAETSETAAWLVREAFKNDWIDETFEVTHSGLWSCKHIPADKTDQIRSYLCESLATALIHPDRLIAFRACLQAHAYSSRLQSEGSHPGGRYHDELVNARNRVEGWLR